MSNLKQPFAEGLRELVSPDWMAVWNRYQELQAQVGLLKGAANLAKTYGDGNVSADSILAAIKGEK